MFSELEEDQSSASTDVTKETLSLDQDGRLTVSRKVA